MNYSSLAFTNVIKSIQDKLGSRESYERVEKMSYVDGLTPIEQSLSASWTVFIWPLSGENGYPYIQHRGGPKGFIKSDRSTNHWYCRFQWEPPVYISRCNITKDPKVSLILVSYPLRARLKMYAEAEIVEIKDRPDLFELLKPTGYKFKPERLLLFHIKAYDWNCPQHITPKYSQEEIEELIQPQKAYIRQLEEEVKALREKLAEQ